MLPHGIPSLLFRSCAGVISFVAAVALHGSAERGVTTELSLAIGDPVRIVPDLRHAEGPAWHPDGYLLFQDTQRNRTLQWDPHAGLKVFREPSGRANALAIDAERRLVAVESHGEGGGRRVVRQTRDGEWHPLAERIEGKRFNSPNDLALDRRGRIYFTDPRYSRRETMELQSEAVYRIDPDGSVTSIVTSLKRPNGILVSGDQRSLYISDNIGPGSVAELWVFDLSSEGSAAKGRKVYDFSPGRGIDGMTLDSEGRIWAAAGTKEKAGIYVLVLNDDRTQAARVAFVPLPEDPMNCTFGGKNRDELYITTSASVFRLSTTVRGRDDLPGK